MKPFAFSYFEALHLIKEDAYCSIYEGILKHDGGKHRLFVYHYPFLQKGKLESLVAYLEHYKALSNTYLCPIWLNLYDGEHYYISLPIDAYQSSLRNYIVNSKSLELSHLEDLLKVIDILYDANLFLGVLDIDAVFLHNEGYLCVFPNFISLFALCADRFSLNYIDSGLIFSPHLLLGKKPYKEADLYCHQVLCDIANNKGIFHNTSQHLETRVNHYLKSEFSLQDPYVKKELELVISGLEKKQFFKKVFRMLCFALPLILLLLLFIGFSRLFWQAPNIKMPNIIGLQFEDAKELLEKQQFRYKIIAKRHHPFLEKEAVLETKPPADRWVKEGRLVRLFLSKGPLSILIPNLRGRSYDESTVLLDNLGLKHDVVVRKKHLIVEKEAVIAQIPEPLVSSQVDVPVQLILSEGFVYDIQKGSRGFFFGFSEDVKIQISAEAMPEYAWQHIKIVSRLEDEQVVLYDKITNLSLPFEEVFYVSEGSRIDFYVQEKLVFSQLEKDL